MRSARWFAAAALAVAGLTLSAEIGYAAPPPPANQNPHPGQHREPPRSAPQSLQCPPLPDPTHPSEVPPRDLRCGVDRWQVIPGLTVTSNAYDRQSTFLYPWGSLQLFGSQYFQLRNANGNLIAGQPDVPQHIPFGSEVPPPTREQNLTDRGRHVYNGLSRVGANVAPGFRYTADLTDKSVFLTTPLGTLVVQAPVDPVTKTRQFRPMNNFQALDPQGRYIMGDTLTFAEPEEDWPNAAIPCVDLLKNLPPEELKPGHGHGAKPAYRLAAHSVAPKPPSEEPTPESLWAQHLSERDNPESQKPPAVGCRPVAGLNPTADTNNEPPSAADRDKDRNDAISAVATQVGFAISIGGLIGGVVGLGLGCLIGGVVGAGGTAASAELLGAGIVGTCIGGATLGATIGGLLGSAALGIPVGIVSGIGAYNLLRDEGDVSLRAALYPFLSPQPAKPRGLYPW